MRYTIKLAIEDDNGEKMSEDVIQFRRNCNQNDVVGLSLLQSKTLLKALQTKIICHQTKEYAKSKRFCSQCNKKLNIKGYHHIQYRTLFGIVNLPSPRFQTCHCHDVATKSFSPLSEWLSDKNSPELQYIETKWSSLISFEQTTKLLKDVLPISESENAATVRNHLHSIAKRQEKELEGKPEYISGCQNEWDKLPKPGKPITIGIDGGYLKNWKNRNNNFEIIAGKSFSKSQPPKRFGFIQKIDNHPKRRIIECTE